jgi:hypothetical protein
MIRFQGARGDEELLHTHHKWLKPPTGRCGGACQTLGKSCNAHGCCVDLNDWHVWLCSDTVYKAFQVALDGSGIQGKDGHTSLVLNTWILPRKIANTRRKTAPALIERISLHRISALSVSNHITCCMGLQLHHQGA